jgi:hypothetical protein
MGYYRLFHPDHFDPARGKFSDVALLKSSDDGISVVDGECVNRSGRSICAHFRKYYSRVAGEPPIFLEIPQEYIPTKSSIVESGSSKRCHKLIAGLSKKEMLSMSKAMTRNIPINQFRICDGTGSRELTIEDVKNPTS